MRRVSVCAALVALVLSALGVAPVDAARGTLKKSTISVRMAPGVVTVDAGNGAIDPTGVLVEVSPARAGRPVTIQRLDGGSWRTVRTTRTNSQGAAFLRVVATELGTTRYRAKVSTSKGFRGTGWKATTLRTRASTDCAPRVPLVDTDRRGEADCLAARLDRWQSAGLMGVGQQLNVSGDEDTWLQPLSGIPAPSVLGFDLEELDYATTKTQYPYGDARIAELIELAHRGAVLTASWHAVNPLDPSQGSSSKRIDLGKLLDPSTVAYQNFWPDWDAKLALLKRFQDDDADGNGISDHDPCWCTPVVVRPLHEVNGAFFWWGRPDPKDYQAVWARLQSGAAASGVHNVVWAYSGNRKTSSTKDPALYVPRQVDIGGLDTYDPEQGRGNAADVLPLEGYSAVAAKVNRMAITEVGPHGSADRKWNPAVVRAGVRRARIRPLWAMFWFNDGYTKEAEQTGVLGYKQLNSLLGGKSFLRSCFNGRCSLR